MAAKSTSFTPTLPVRTTLNPCQLTGGGPDPRLADGIASTGAGTRAGPYVFVKKQQLSRSDLDRRRCRISWTHPSLTGASASERP